MNTDTFWKLIEDAQRKQEDGWIELDHEKLIESLTHLSAEDIQEFDNTFFRMKGNAYRADLWDAAYFVACGCGDDAFGDMRDWLIRQGREIYESVINDPDNLADIVPRKHRFDLYDVSPDRKLTIMHVSQVAYERKMGQPIPYWGDEGRSELVGEHIDDDDKLADKFPRIMGKLGQYSDEDVESTWLS